MPLIVELDTALLRCLTVMAVAVSIDEAVLRRLHEQGLIDAAVCPSLHDFVADHASFFEASGTGFRLRAALSASLLARLANDGSNLCQIERVLKSIMPHFAERLAYAVAAQDHEAMASLYRWAIELLTTHVQARRLDPSLFCEFLYLIEGTLPDGCLSVMRKSAWHTTLGILASALGPAHPDTLGARRDHVEWLARRGETQAALDLHTALLPDLVCVKGPGHPDTLRARSSIAILTGEAGRHRLAWRLLEGVIADQARALGPAHPDTLASRNMLAHQIGALGDMPRVLRILGRLLSEQQRVLDDDHPLNAVTRANIAYWRWQAGELSEALRLFRALLREQRETLGDCHAALLPIRNNVAGLIADGGHPRDALKRFGSLLRDELRHMGPDHRLTLLTRNNIAHWTGRAGDPARALSLYEALLPDQTQTLGADHPDTLRARNNMAYWICQQGDVAKAARLFEELRADAVRLLEPESRAARLIVARAVRLGEYLTQGATGPIAIEARDLIETEARCNAWD